MTDSKQQSRKREPMTPRPMVANGYLPHQFKKGQPSANPSGRPKGSHNRTTQLLKDAILMGAELEGDIDQAAEEGVGFEGLIGYCRWLARNYPVAYASLMGRVLPMQIKADLNLNDGIQYRTPEEVRKALRERGMPDSAIYALKFHELPRRRQQAAPMIDITPERDIEDQG